MGTDQPSTTTTSRAAESSSWTDMRPYAGATVVLAGGILLTAINVYLTTSLLPSAVADIGGQSYYAWVTTAYMIASVVSAMLVSQALGRYGARRAYVIAFGTFVAGSLLAAVTPTMGVLLVGRVIQGLGGGVLSGLAFATIRTTLPARLWALGTAVVSAMFAIGTLVGPALGGAFAQFGSWRLAFGSVALLGVILGELAPRVLPATGEVDHVESVPYPSLALLSAAAAAISIGSIVTGVVPVAVALGCAAILLLGFVAWERRAPTTVLPKPTYDGGSALRWVYLSIGLTTAAVATEAFTPLFGQRLIGLGPLVAGFLGATISAGWSLAGLGSVRAGTPRAQRRLRLVGTAVLAGGLLVAAALQTEPSNGWLVLGWAIALVIAGSGIGLAFPHMSVAAMSSSDDEQQAAKAAAGVPMVGLISQSMVVAIGGVLVSVTSPSVADAARSIFSAIALLALLGLLCSARALRAES